MDLTVKCEFMLLGSWLGVENLLVGLWCLSLLRIEILANEIELRDHEFWTDFYVL